MYARVNKKLAFNSLIPLCCFRHGSFGYELWLVISCFLTGIHPDNRIWFEQPEARLLPQQSDDGPVCSSYTRIAPEKPAPSLNRRFQSHLQLIRCCGSTQKSRRLVRTVDGQQQIHREEYRQNGDCNQIYRSEAFKFTLLNPTTGWLFQEKQNLTSLMP